MPKLVNNLGKVFHKYSFIAHIMNAVFNVGMVLLTPYFGYLSVQSYALISGGLALLGVAGSFIKQEIEDYEDELENKSSKGGK